MRKSLLWRFDFYAFIKSMLLLVAIIIELSTGQNRGGISLQYLLAVLG